MKGAIAAVGGFLATLAVFGGGAFTAITLFGAEPARRPLDMDTAALWTNNAVTVSTKTDGLERLPARPQAAAPIEARQDDEPAPTETTDMMQTAAIDPAPAPEAEMNESHIAWCYEHYRSYDPADNSYNAFSGAKRECVSPYLAAAPHEEQAVYVEAAVTTQDASGAGYLNADHVQSCFDRYRSYRPEDNSYMPYGGGERLQCE